MANIHIVGPGVVGQAIGTKLASIASLDMAIDYIDINDPLPTDGLFIICTPEQAIDGILAKLPLDAHVIIKSTVPLGYTASLNRPNVCFIPEFLRQATALDDVMNPWRLIIEPKAIPYIGLFKGPTTKIIHVNNSTEAEAIKLLSNAYLASRVVFFNEVDHLAINWNLDTSILVEGICADPRIGNEYNRISPGYGGACLPKDIDHLINGAYFRQINKRNADRIRYCITNKYLLRDLENLSKESEYFKEIFHG